MEPIEYRATKVSEIPRQIGIYALCDLDEVPIYVGQSTDGIQNRVRRHLTSARSDVIANRQIDVWEIAYVWAWPVDSPGMLNPLEAQLFHTFNAENTLMNGTVPTTVQDVDLGHLTTFHVQIMHPDEIESRKHPARRLPRQLQQFQNLVDHILNVKDSSQLRTSLVAHFERLQKYYEIFLAVD